VTGVTSTGILNPLADIAQLQKVDFVMKGGKIIRNDLNP